MKACPRRHRNLGVSVLFVVACGAGGFLWSDSRHVRAQPGAAQGAKAAPTKAPTSETLFGDEWIPYRGLGAAWIRPDGLILIETADNGGIAFKAKVSTLSLFEDEGGEVHFKTSAPSEQLIHRFSPETVRDAKACSAVFHHAGDLTLDYDEETGRLDIRVDGGKQSFVAVFNFTGSQDPAVLARAEVSPPVDDGGTYKCECSYYGPPGGSCSASTECPPGYTCTCTCNRNGCECSPCRRLRAIEVLVEPSAGGGPAESP